MAYTVLARRWRPQGFEEVIGQAHVTRTLSNELESGRIGHAFLFSGSRGVGKTTTARILAKALNCAAGPTPKPCGTCESCQAVSSGQAVDVIEIDGASNRGIDEIRDLRENVRYAPVSSRFKIFIIDEVHMLTKEAFNALLKTLEEPPERVKFILATTESHKVPATIRSRCQHFDFRLVATEALLQTLEGIVRKENLNLTQKSLRLVAMAGRGSVRDSLSLLEQVLAFAGPEAAEEDVASILGIARLEVFHSFMDGILAQDVELLLRTTERLLESGYDLYQITQAFLDYLRDLSVLAAVAQAGGLVDRAPEELPRLQAYAKKFDLDTLLRYFQVAQQTAEKMRASTYPRPLFEMMLVGLSRIRSLQPVAELAKRLGELEQSLRSGTPPADRPPSMAKNETRNETRNEPRNEPRNEARNEARPEARSEARNERRPDAASERPAPGAHGGTAWRPPASQGPAPVERPPPAAPQHTAQASSVVPPTGRAPFDAKFPLGMPSTRPSAQETPERPARPAEPTFRVSPERANQLEEADGATRTPSSAPARTPLQAPAAHTPFHSRTAHEVAADPAPEARPEAGLDSRARSPFSLKAAHEAVAAPSPEARPEAGLDSRARPAGTEAPTAGPEPAAPKAQAPVPLEPQPELGVLDKACGRLSALQAPKTLLALLRAAGVRQLGPETTLLLDQGQLFARKQLEDAKSRAMIEGAIAAELGLPQVRLRLEIAAAGSFQNLQQLDRAARREQERVWGKLARAVDGVKQALDLFGGRILSVTVLEEDGESVIPMTQES